MKCNHRRRTTVHMLRYGRFQRGGGQKKQNRTARQERAGGRELLRPASLPDGPAAAQKGRTFDDAKGSEDRHWPVSQRDAFISD